MCCYYGNSVAIAFQNSKLQQKKKMNSKFILALLLVVGVANLQADTDVPKCFGKGKNTCQN